MIVHANFERITFINLFVRSICWYHNRITGEVLRPTCSMLRKNCGSTKYTLHSAENGLLCRERVYRNVVHQRSLAANRACETSLWPVCIVFGAESGSFCHLRCGYGVMWTQRSSTKNALGQFLHETYERFGMQAACDARHCGIPAESSPFTVWLRRAV